MSYNIPLLPTFRRQRNLMHALDNSTGVTTIAAGYGTVALDATKSFQGKAQCTKCVSATASASGFTIALSSPLNLTNYTSVSLSGWLTQGGNYTIYFSDIAPNGSGVFTQNVRRAITPAAGDIGHWFTHDLMKGDMSTTGAVNLANINYVQVQCAGVSGQVQTSWWQDIVFMDAQNRTCSLLSGAGVIQDSLANSGELLSITGQASYAFETLSGVPCLYMLSNADTNVVATYDMGSYKDFEAAGFSMWVWRDPTTPPTQDLYVEWKVSDRADVASWNIAGPSSAKEVFNPGWNEVKWHPSEFTASRYMHDVRYLQVSIMADPGSQQTSSAIANFTTDVATIPVIINCFDDVWAGVATDAYNALSAVGFHGTCFAANSLIGTAGYIAWSGCQNLHAAGWDISNHGVIHEDMSGLTQAQAEANIGGMRTILQGYGFNRRNEDANFAFPYGSSSAACYAACLTQGIRVARLASDPNGQAYLSHGSLRMTPFGAYCCSPGVSGVPATDWATLKAKLVSMTMRGDVAMIMWHNEATTWGSVFVQAMQWMAQMQRCGLFKVMSLTEYLAAA